jgi:hypothetical protein
VQSWNRRHEIDLWCNEFRNPNARLDRTSAEIDSSVELQSCPFCGGEPRDWYGQTDGGTSIAGVACSCGAEMIDFALSASDMYREWNTRFQYSAIATWDFDGDSPPPVVLPDGMRWIKERRHCLDSWYIKVNVTAVEALLGHVQWDGWWYWWDIVAREYTRGGKCDTPLESCRVLANRLSERTGKDYGFVIMPQHITGSGLP